MPESSVSKNSAEITKRRTFEKIYPGGNSLFTQPKKGAGVDKPGRDRERYREMKPKIGEAVIF